MKWFKFDPSEITAVQSRLFDLGYSWYISGKAYQLNKEDRTVMYLYPDKVLAWDSGEWARHQRLTEIPIAEALQLPGIDIYVTPHGTIKLTPGNVTFSQLSVGGPINITTTPPPCKCINLLAGHEPGCGYHKPEDLRGKGLGMQPQVALTRVEINAKYRGIGE